MTIAPSLGFCKIPQAQQALVKPLKPVFSMAVLNQPVFFIC
jgi:hypothetical protein